MIKMERGQFYLLIWMLVTGTGSFFEVDMQALSALSIILGVGLYAHYNHIEKQKAAKRKEEYERQQKIKSE